MNKKQAIKQIDVLLQEIGSVQFKVHTLSVSLFKAIKYDSLDYNVINYLYSKMGKGINKTAYRNWIVGMTPLTWDREKEAFIKPKNKKWDSLNTVLLDATPYYKFEKESKAPAAFNLDNKITSLDTRIKNLIKDAIEANNGVVDVKIAQLQAIELSFNIFNDE